MLRRFRRWWLRRQLSRAVRGYPDSKALSERALAAMLAQIGDPRGRFVPPTEAEIDLAGIVPWTAEGCAYTAPLADLRRECPPLRGIERLRDAVARDIHRRCRVDVDPQEQLMITPGGSGAFALALDALLEPGDSVVLFSPGSPLFTRYIASRRGRIRWVPHRVYRGRVSFDFDVLRYTLRGAKLLVLTQPSNPTAGRFSTTELAAITFLAKRMDVLIYCDLSLSRFMDDWQEPVQTPFEKAPDRTLLASSFALSHGLASARVGWLAGPPALIGAIEAAASVSCGPVPAPVQGLALDHLAEECEQTAREFAQRRRFAFERLRSFGLMPWEAGGGVFLWVPVPTDDREFARELRKSQGVVVTPGSVFSPGGDGHVRLSFAGEPGRLNEGLRRLGEFISRIRLDAAEIPLLDSPSRCEADNPAADPQPAASAA